MSGNWFKENWHWGAGAAGGAVGGSLLLSKTIGKIFGEDTGFQRFCSWVGGILGACGGVYLAGVAADDDRAEDLVADLFDGDLSLEDVEKTFKGLTDDLRTKKDDFAEFAAEKFGVAEDAAKDLYIHLDGIDGPVDDNITATLPKVIQETYNHLTK